MYLLKALLDLVSSKEKSPKAVKHRNRTKSTSCEVSFDKWHQNRDINYLSNSILHQFVQKDRLFQKLSLRKRLQTAQKPNSLSCSLISILVCFYTQLKRNLISHKSALDFNIFPEFLFDFTHKTTEHFSVEIASKM